MELKTKEKAIERLFDISTPRFYGSTKIESENELKRHWKRCIDGVNIEINHMKNHALVVGYIAYHACNIKWGGGNHWNNFKDVYTLKKFAEDTDTNVKTLHEWVRQYKKVVQPLGINPVTATEVERTAITRTQRTAYASHKPAEVKEIYKKHKKEVERGVKSGRKNTGSVYNFVKGLKSVRFGLKSGVINKADKFDAGEMKSLIKEIYEEIEKTNLHKG